MSLAVTSPSPAPTNSVSPRFVFPGSVSLGSGPGNRAISRAAAGQTPADASPSTPGGPTGLAQLSRIGLDQLTAHAALLTRVDRKYVLPAAELDRLLDGVSADAAALEIEGRRTFAYRSTYWDTADLLSFRMAGQGRRRRFKVRTRTYLDTGDRFLEVKTRGARGTTVKERIPYLLTGERLQPEGARFVADRLAGHGTVPAPPETLRPVLSTSYLRATLATADGQGRPARATIDTALAFADPYGSGALAIPDLAVVETKGSSSPSPVDRTLWSLGHRPVRVSKYGTGLALLHEEVPTYKWHNVIHRHFRP